MVHLHLVDTLEEADYKWIDIADFLSEKAFLGALKVVKNCLFHKFDDVVLPFVHHIVVEIVGNDFVKYAKIKTFERVVLRDRNQLVNICVLSLQCWGRGEDHVG